MDMANRLYEILEQVRPDVDFHHTLNLATDGYIDSFDIVTIINLIESEFNVEVPVEKMVPESFDSVEGMIEMIKDIGGDMG